MKIYVAFADKKLEEKFELLKEGKYEDRNLYESISKVISELKSQKIGIKIKKELWPGEYVKKYEITNLWKSDLPKGWRIVYTIKTDEVIILNIILEWFNHKEYERRFKYH